MRNLALVAVLAGACGNGNPETPDANGGPSDAADAAPDADPNLRGPVTVRIVNKSGAPLPGMHVVFIDTDTTVTDLITDSAGTATANVYPGASATALRARDGGQGFSLTTVQALVPDDTITLISASGAAASGEDPFTQRIVPLPSADIATATKSGSTATFTTIAPHGLATADRVIVASVLDAGYNGTWTVSGTPNATTFTANLGSGGLADSTGGIAAKGLPFTLTYPAYGGATSYEVHTPCGPIDVGTTTSPLLTLRDGCASSPMEVLVFAKTSATVEAAYVQQSVTFAAGGNATITDTWHALSPITATFANPTTRVNMVEVQRYTPHVRGNSPITIGGTTKGNPLELAFSAAAPPGAWMRTVLSCPSGSGPGCVSSPIGVAQQTITQRVDGTANGYALNIRPALLPWVSAEYLPQESTLAVWLTGAGTIDLFEANLRYVRGQIIYTWRVFGPVARSIVFPKLPRTLPGDPTLRPTDTQSVYQAYLCESNAIAGYRDAIKNVYEALATCEVNTLPTTKPVPGLLNRLSSWN